MQTGKPEKKKMYEYTTGEIKIPGQRTSQKLKLKSKSTNLMRKLMRTTLAKLQTFCTLVLIAYLIQTPFIRGTLLGLVDLLNTPPTLSPISSQK